MALNQSRNTEFAQLFRTVACHATSPEKPWGEEDYYSNRPSYNLVVVNGGSLNLFCGIYGEASRSYKFVLDGAEVEKRIIGHANLRGRETDLSLDHDLCIDGTVVQTDPGKNNPKILNAKEVVELRETIEY